MASAASQRQVAQMIADPSLKFASASFSNLARLIYEKQLFKPTETASPEEWIESVRSAWKMSFDETGLAELIKDFNRRFSRRLSPPGSGPRGGEGVRTRRSVSPDELREILRLHSMYLNGPNAGKRADLAGADLTGANLKRAKLEYALLTGADLTGADLTGADLRYARLADANLFEADLEEANLEEANLGGANLKRANLRGANLRGANLRGANLDYADLAGTTLLDANLKRARLRYADLEDAHLRNADLTGANLEYANLMSAHLRNANLTNAIIRYDVDLRLADFTGADLSGADLRGAIYHDYTKFPDGFDPVAAGMEKSEY